MKTKTEITRACTNLTPITFQDVVACFSEDEWKLLQEWQKEIYKNVMNNINQALISLGPLIATSVFSLNANEKKVSSQVENNCEITQDVYCTSGHKSDSSDIFFQQNQDDNQHHKCYEETDEVLANNSLNTTYPVLSFDNVMRMEQEFAANVPTHQDAYAEQSHINVTSLGHESILPIISFKIKDEEENYSMNQRDSARTGNTTVYKGHEQVKRQRQAKIPLSDTSSSKAHVTGFHQSQHDINFRSQLSVENNTNLGGERIQQCKTVLRKETYSNFHMENPIAGTPNAFNECASDVRDIIVNTSPQNTHQNWRQTKSSDNHEQNVIYKESFALESRLDTNSKGYTCTECGKSFTQMGNLLRHKTIHFGQKPYKCTICEKCFSQKVHFIRHQRTHSGERPYQCTECKKRFSRKEGLLAHQRTHTGDKPYHCSECEKSYSVKQSLIFHQRKHTGEKPYQCTICDKRFSWKQNFIGHQRTHIAAQFEGNSTATF